MYYKVKSTDNYVKKEPNFIFFVPYISMFITFKIMQNNSKVFLYQYISHDLLLFQKIVLLFVRCYRFMQRFIFGFMDIS